MRHLWFVALVGCTGSGDVPTGLKIQEGHAPAVGALGRAPSINALEPYERLVRNFETCALEGNQIVSTCPAVRTFETEMQGVSRDIAAKVGAKMIGHRSAAVRVQAASMVHFDVLARAARTEDDPHVLEAFVRIAGKHAASDSYAQQLLITAAKHPDSGVRLDVVDALSGPGALDMLVTLSETDADPRVRAAACTRAGTLGTDAVLPLYERTTATIGDPQLYAACMQGLAARVVESEPAYHLFLRRIAQTPRSEHTPPWTVMSLFCDLPAAKRPSWLDPKEVRTVLASVIVDRAAAMQARSAAVESLAGLDAPPAELATLRKALSDLGDKALVEKIDALCQ